MDVRNMGGKKTLVLTDSTVAKLPACRSVEQALRSVGVAFDVWDGVRVEPTDISIQVMVFPSREQTKYHNNCRRPSTRRVAVRTTRLLLLVEDRRWILRSVLPYSLPTRV